MDEIAERFWMLATFPYAGRSRDGDLRTGLRSFPVRDYLIIYRVDSDELVMIIHVVHGSRDLDSLIRP